MVWEQLVSIAGDLYIIFIGSLTIYVTFTGGPQEETITVHRCVNGWKAIGIILIGGGFIGLLNWFELPLMSLNRDFPSLIVIAYLIILGLMTVFYPKTVLYNQAQNIRAMDLYESVSKDTQQKNAKIN